MSVGCKCWRSSPDLHTHTPVCLPTLLLFSPFTVFSLPLIYISEKNTRTSHISHIQICFTHITRQRRKNPVNIYPLSFLIVVLGWCLFSLYIPAQNLLVRLNPVGSGLQKDLRVTIYLSLFHLLQILVWYFHILPTSYCSFYSLVCPLSKIPNCAVSLFFEYW